MIKITDAGDRGVQINDLIKGDTFKSLSKPSPHRKRNAGDSPDESTPQHYIVVEGEEEEEFMAVNLATGGQRALDGFPTRVKITNLTLTEE